MTLYSVTRSQPKFHIAVMLLMTVLLIFGCGQDHLTFSGVGGDRDDAVGGSDGDIDDAQEPDTTPDGDADLPQDPPDPDGDVVESAWPWLPCEPFSHHCQGGRLHQCSADGAAWDKWIPCNDEYWVCLGNICYHTYDFCQDRVNGCSSSFNGGDEDQRVVTYCEPISSFDAVAEICDEGGCYGGVCGRPCNGDDKCDAPEICHPLDPPELLDTQRQRSHGVCMEPCVDDSNCPEDAWCIKGRCTGKQDRCLDGWGMCETDQFCLQFKYALWGICVSDCSKTPGSCPAEHVCETDPENPSHGLCLPDYEAVACNKSSDHCPAGTYCETTIVQDNGYCRKSCGADSPCPKPFDCVSGRCKLTRLEGDCDDDCPRGYVCDPDFNICILNCPVCESGYLCHGGSAPECILGICANRKYCGSGRPECCIGYRCSESFFGLTGGCVKE